ncbi:hypothetical protein [Shouchella patagoniensis]|uniref:hypothetical protein n=1 Tax=Shouchella patagoniensis TaxID=228576 RepID=UPI000995CA75|nr:hypothetical protein [Shouchella patagoniensis]
MYNLNWQARNWVPFQYELRQFPAIDTSELSQSVQRAQYLLQQSQILLTQLGRNTFAYQLMDAAQKSNKALVQRLINSIPGLTVVADIQYSPTGIVFLLQSPGISGAADCCSLSIVLKWG